jgi:hypothetical protein
VYPSEYARALAELERVERELGHTFAPVDPWLLVDSSAES